jgi:hypothetical protein
MAVCAFSSWVIPPSTIGEGKEDNLLPYYMLFQLFLPNLFETKTSLLELDDVSNKEGQADFILHRPITIITVNSF